MLGYPRRVLAGALVCVAILGILGKDVENDLTPVSPSMPGSESAQTDAQLERYFGDAAPFAVLLRGPGQELDEQGPKLIRVLRRDPDVTTLSPWDRGPVDGLRPGRRRALVLIDFHDGIGEAVEKDVAYLGRLLEEHISPPVVATESSYPSFLKGVKDASNDAAKRAETIVFPALLLVLLFVFRSPLAAVVPLLLGAGTIISARGLLSVLSNWADIDAFAFPVSAMIGLALGVDYTLLMVSRFREELATGATPISAARETRRTAGRTVLGAGGTLFVSLAIVLFFVPGPLFRSVIGSMLLVTTLSVLFALVVAPAVLTLLGARVDRWRVGSHRNRRARWMVWVDGALRRPGITAAAIAFLMFFLALPALSLQIGPSGLDQLPRDNEVRRNTALVDHFVGPGWTAPFIVVASTEKGSITDPHRFDAISRWQKQIAARPDVQAVIGPSRIVDRVVPLRNSANELLSEKGDRRLGGLQRLGSRLERAAAGVLRLRNGLFDASAGAGLLGDGSQRAVEGTLALANGLRRASEGTQRGKRATGQLASGSERIVQGQRSLRSGALVLALGLNDLLPIVAKEGLGVARPLRSDLSRRARTEPELERNAEQAARLVVQFAKAKSEVTRLRRLANRLHAGLGVLTKGSQRLQRGAKLLSNASERLNSGLKGLGDGSEELAAGLSSLTGGTNALEEHLADGAERTSGLQSGLRRGGVVVSTEGKTLRRNVESLKRNSPEVFNSGHFVLSVLDGTSQERREDIGQTIDLNGGQAVRMLVVSKYPLNSLGSRGLYDELRRSTVALERRGGSSVGITGGEAQLADFADIATSRFPLSVVAITIASFLMLVVLLRALLLPALAVLLNLASVAVAFGVLALIAQIPSGYPLGGHSILDVTGATAVFTVAFGLSIDYSVFLMMRMRESYELDGDHARAISAGIESTGRVISGAAAVMAVVFLAFASVPVAFLSQMGIGLAVAILLDATVVRLVLLPAIMMLLGDRVWKLPSKLQRVLPGT